jgi:hypothetical protein
LKLQTPLENPLSTFAYALQSEGTKRQYPRKLKVFFDFCLQQSNDLETQAVEFAQKCRDRNWVNAQIIHFIIFQKERMYKEGISAGTVRNYIKPIKLFCEMNVTSIIHNSRMQNRIPKLLNL